MSSNDAVYVELKGEGTNVWRPVAAESQHDGTWLLLGPVPADEEWAFGPGTVVRCIEHSFEGGRRGLLAIEAVEA